MALYHDATLSPTKTELVAQWLPAQTWIEEVDSADVIGAYRFDDPEGRVGMETHLVRIGSEIVQVPMTYRDAPLDGAEQWLIGETEHSVLGTRWVYDGLGDPRYRLMLAAVSMTGQGESLGMVVFGDEWFIAPTPVRISGGGWTTERVSVDGLEPAGADGELDAPTCVFRNERFELTVHRRVRPAPAPSIGLTATWQGLAEPVVLTEVVEI